MAAASIRLLLLTGCRKSELLGARWDEFDLDAGVWVKPAARVKANREHRLPLSPQAVAELNRLPRTGPLVFTNSRGKPWTEVAAWPQIRDEARIANVRLHDLRHSAASLLISRGLSLQVIGRILGHSQASTTERYAHLHSRAAGTRSVCSCMAYRAGLREVCLAVPASRSAAWRC